EIKRWEDKPVVDQDDSYGLPLQWHLTKGKHTLRLQGASSIVLDSIAFRPPTQIPSYEVVYAEYPQADASGTEPIVIEAEMMEEKNEVSIQMLSDQDAFMTPRADGREIFNGVG